MDAYVAGEKIKIDNVPLVPTFKPNVLSHGKLKESGMDIRLDANPPYMVIKRVNIILIAHKYVYYFIAYPVYEVPDYEDIPLRLIDTLEEPECDDAPFSVHEPAAIWALSASAITSSKYASLQDEHRSVQKSSGAWKCRTRSTTSSCSFKEGSYTSG